MMMILELNGKRNGGHLARRDDPD